MIPKARNTNLEINQSKQDTTIYNRENNSTVRLDRVTALVREKCDGINSPWEIRQQIWAERGKQINEDTVWFALTRLQRLHLLESNGDDSIERYSSLLESQELTKTRFSCRLNRSLVNLVSYFSSRSEKHPIRGELH